MIHMRHANDSHGCCSDVLKNKLLSEMVFDCQRKIDDEKLSLKQGLLSSRIVDKTPC